MGSARVNRHMAKAEHEALEQSLREACQQMSREQVIALADSLLDFARARREETRWDPSVVERRI